MLNPVKMYDYLALARGRVLDKVRTLSPEDYTRQFPIGLGSLARTLTHIMGSEWYYVQRMLDREVPDYSTWPIQDEKPPAFGVLNEHWKGVADGTRAAIATLNENHGWHRVLEYRYTDDHGRRMVSTATPADQFTQLYQHEVHHRAQVVNMLKQLGHTLGDLDFNMLMFARRPE
ncbi:MAG TPA: DinB family protein [Phycisphaerales bacterium]|nr:DinB family protein [Phycisphaerales bacterium]